MKMLQNSINKFKNGNQDLVPLWKSIILSLNILSDKQLKIRVVALYKCSQCLLPGQKRTMLLSCGHSMCYNCLIKQISIATDDSFDDDYVLVKCMQCAIQLSLSEIHSIALPADIYKRNQEYHAKNANHAAYALLAEADKKHKNKNPNLLQQLESEFPSVVKDYVTQSYSCVKDVLYIAFEANNALKIDPSIENKLIGDHPGDAHVPVSECKHFISIRTATNHIKALVHETQITQDSFGCEECAQNRCIYPIKLIQFAHETSFGIISNNIISKLSEIALSKKNTIYKFEEQIIQCKRCNTKVFAKVNTTYFLCPNCNIYYCSLCKGMPHDNCEDYQRVLKEQDEYMKKAEAKRCPHCLQWVLKESGCNYITCSSSLCAMKTHFCYLCECKLDESKHCAHFYYHPYGRKCKGITDASN